MNEMKNSIFPWWGLIPPSIDDIFYRPDTFNEGNFLKPSYDFEDKGDTYEIDVDYDEKRDQLTVSVNDNVVKISIFGDWEKQPGAWSTTYYGTYTLTAPKDCEAQSLEQEHDAKNKKMKLVFKKVEKPVVKETEVDYKSLCEKLTAENETLKAENKELITKIESIKQSLF